MNKAHSPINWENFPSENTAVNAENLNQMDTEIGLNDDRIIELDTTKAAKTEVANTIVNVEFDDKTGIITCTRKNGVKFTIDTLLEKIAINFGYDSTTQKITIHLQDGTIKEIDLSALITQYEFMNTDTVAFSIDTDGKISAMIPDGSITEDKINPNYLAQIRVQVSSAENSASNAQKAQNEATTQATNAKESASKALTSANNAEQSFQQAKSLVESLPASIRPKGDILFANLPSVGSAVVGDMYNVTDAFTTTSDFTEGEGHEVAAGSEIYMTVDSKWSVYGGTGVVGVKGDAETNYRQGNVNITKANIGLGNVPNVSTNNQTPTWTVATTRKNIVSKEKLSIILGKIAKFFSDLSELAFSGSWTDLKDIPTNIQNADTYFAKQTDMTQAQSDISELNLGMEGKKITFLTSTNSVQLIAKTISITPYDAILVELGKGGAVFASCEMAVSNISTYGYRSIQPIGKYASVEYQGVVNIDSSYANIVSLQVTNNSVMMRVFGIKY